MTLYIKNMVCDRCKMAVTRELEKLKIPFQKVDLGEVVLKANPNSTKIQDFKRSIEPLGFELIRNQK